MKIKRRAPTSPVESSLLAAGGVGCAPTQLKEEGHHDFSNE